MNWIGEICPDIIAEIGKRPNPKREPLVPRPCTECGKEFQPDHESVSWCSHECTVAHYAKERRKDFREWALSSVPTSYRWARFDAPEFAERVPKRDGIKLALDALESRAPRVVIQGGAGDGKTSLAVAMLSRLVDSWTDLRSLPGVFCHSYRLGLARAQYGLGEGEPPAVLRAMEANILLLDDLGSERQTQNNAVPDVLFERHAEDMVTWITTGLSAKQIAERYGDGIARRVFEHAVIINLGKTE